MARNAASDNGAGSHTQRAVQSVEVGGRLLLVLADSDGPLPLKELAERAGMVPSRAHPYLVSYARLGLVEQDVATARYDLGPSALRMGLACLQRFDPLKLAEPVARDLASRTGHAVALSVWGNFGPTVVRMIEARQALHITMRVGSVLAVFETATGRAFAAALPDDRLREGIAGPLGAPQAGDTLRLRHQELTELRQQFQRHGLCRSVGSPIPGVNAFSAPVFDHEGTPVLVITATDHEDRMPGHWNASTASAVRAAAREITARLGGQTEP